jgi:hypothetical protein
VRDRIVKMLQIFERELSCLRENERIDYEWYADKIIKIMSEEDKNN